MQIQFGADYYWTEEFADDNDGFAGIRLFRTTFDKSSKAAEVIYWDATGGFTIETFGRVLPIEIADKLIAEAVEKIKTK